jgi:hypothetical protein
MEQPMNTNQDNHALTHDHQTNPVSLLRANIAASDNALLHSLDLHEDIQNLAYHKWQAAGRPGGDGVHFWLKAEQELAEHELARGAIDQFVGRDHRQLDHELGNKAAQENAKALNRSVNSHYRDNNRMFQRHGDRGHRHGIKTK